MVGTFFPLPKRILETEVELLGKRGVAIQPFRQSEMTPPSGLPLGPNRIEFPAASCLQEGKDLLRETIIVLISFFFLYLFISPTIIRTNCRR